MGVVFSSMFALGLLLYVWARSEVHLEHILFGDVLGTSPQDLLESGSIALVVAGWISLKWRDLMLQSFDPVQARTAVSSPFSSARPPSTSPITASPATCAPSNRNCEAKLASARSSAVADDRTATGGSPSCRYAVVISSLTDAGNSAPRMRERAALVSPRAAKRAVSAATELVA